MTFITTMKEIKHRKWYIKNKSLGFLFVKTDPQSYQMFKSNRKLPCLQYAPYAVLRYLWLILLHFSLI